jgi:hypothetical protein
MDKVSIESARYAFKRTIDALMSGGLSAHRSIGKRKCRIPMPKGTESVIRTAP